MTRLRYLPLLAVVLLALLAGCATGPVYPPIAKQ